MAIGPPLPTHFVRESPRFDNLEQSSISFCDSFCNVEEMCLHFLQHVRRQGQTHCSEALGKQGWRSGESAHLAPMWPGFDSQTLRHMWVQFVVGSRPYSQRFFSGYSSFPLSQKNNIF